MVESGFVCCTFSSIVELRTVLPQLGIPCNQRRDLGVIFQSANSLLSMNHEPVFEVRIFSALL